MGGTCHSLGGPRELLHVVQADVKDILGVVRGGDGNPSRPAPKKEKMKRPEGMSREAFALLGDSHPIAPVVELSKKAELKGLKEKRKISSPNGTVSRRDQVNHVSLRGRQQADRPGFPC